MSDQISGIDRQIRPDEAMQLLGVKKDAYHDRRKFLGIEHVRDKDGKVWLHPDDFQRMQELGDYINRTGKMDGFPNSKSEAAELAEPSELAIASESSLLDQVIEAEAEEGDRLDLPFEELIRAAAELKGQQLVMPQLVVRELANRMTYEDLPADVRQRVDQAREAATPKFQPSRLADDLLSQWRTQSQKPIAV